ncbi:AraC family transcriptional regulator [Escherichia coli]|uniref:AraC family transcriptional regulator n=1 Tax=Escherichia coli TaxID=562 RepID=UPI000BE5F0F9|nr:AraC family transcriptional regulator [Escherichia coli]
MKLNNIHLYNYVILYAKNCDVIIKTKNNEVVIPYQKVAILEKNISFNVIFKRKNAGVLYESIDITDEMINKLKNVMEPLVNVSTEKFTQKRNLIDRVFIIEPCPVTIDIFQKLMNSKKSDYAKVYKLAYLASKSEDLTKVALSIYSSVSLTFTEKINKVVQKDISKKWKLSDLAEEIHMSEISIRKKLEQEDINFNQLLLDARMNKAVKYLLKNEMQISMISEMVGYSSISYFIKTFKNYYGITPKQFELGVKENLLKVM